MSLVSRAGNAAEGAAAANATAPVVPLLPGAPPPASGTDVEAQTSQHKLKRTKTIVGLVDGEAGEQYGETIDEVDSDGDVKLRYDNGDTSSWIKARKLKAVDGGADKVLLCRDT